jgi:flagellar biosynthesis protein FliR
MVGFPINLSIGLVLFSLLLLNFFPMLEEITLSMGKSLSHLIGLMQGG